MAQPNSYAANRVLAALSPDEMARIQPHLTPSLFHLGDNLWEAGQQPPFVVFMKFGLVSLMLASRSGVDVEVGIIGHENIAGATEILGGSLATTRAAIQGAGSGWRMAPSEFKNEFERGGSFQKAVMRGIQTQNFQTSQCALCNRLHSVEQRLSRWLLMANNRLGVDEMQLTHEFIASMLGTRRAGVTVAAGILRERGLIDYSRGLVAILDRAGLEKTACECYAAIERGLGDGDESRK